MVCHICKCGINPSAKSIECSVCKNFCHKLCIPGMHKYDYFYTNIENVDDWICSQCNESIFPYNHIDDDRDFVLCLSDHWCVTVGSDIKELNENILTHSKYTVGNVFSQCLIATQISTTTIYCVVVCLRVIIIWMFHSMLNAKINL